MRSDEWLDEKIKLLSGSDIVTARLDALVLLEDACDKDRGWLLAHPEHVIGQSILKTLDAQIERRLSHEPLAYIRGTSEFYGRSYAVTPATLQPRSETETMVDLLKSLGLEETSSIADIGTGSGCVAITAKLEWPLSEVYATEINADALNIAKRNARDLKAEVTFYEGNLLEPLLKDKKRPLVLLANLPYVPDSHTINKAAMQEPKVAIFGGEDGLDLYREMFAQIEVSGHRPNYVLTESLPFQHKELAAIALRSDYRLSKTEDFIQVFVPKV